MSGSNPISAIGNALSSIGNAVASAASDVASSINDVFNPITAAIGSLSEELGTSINAVMSDLGSVAGDIEEAGATFGNAIGAAASDLAAEATAGLGSIITATTDAVSNLGTLVESSMGTLIQDELGGLSLSEVEANVDSFAQMYGHVLIDVAADTIAPGSSVLIDAAWDIAQNGGQFPTLQGLEQDAAQAAVGEVLPGMDDAIAAELPDLLSDVVSGAANSALGTFASDVANHDSTAQIFADVLKAAENGAGSDLTNLPDVQDDMESGLASLFGGDDLDSAAALKANIDIISNAGTTASELLITANALAGMSPAELLSLAAGEAGLPDISQIGALISGSGLDVDLAQALALGSTAITFASDAQAAVMDAASTIEGLSVASIGELQAEGITALIGDDSGLSFDESQAMAILDAGLHVAGTTGNSLQTAATVALDLTQTQFDALSQAQLDMFQTLGFNALDISGASNFTWNYAESAAFLQAGLSLTGGVTATFAATAADIISLTNGGGLSFTQLGSLANAGVTTVTVSGTAAEMAQIPNAALADIGAAGIANVAYSVTDSVTDLINLSAAAQLALINNFPDLTWNVSDNVADLLALTTASRTTLSALGVTDITCADTASTIDKLTKTKLITLHSDGVTTLASTSTNPVVTASLASALIVESIGFAAATPGGLVDTGTNLAKLTAAAIGDLASIGITSMASSSATTTLNSAQLLAIAASGLSFSVPAGGTLIDADTGANIAGSLGVGGLSNEQILQLAALGVSRLIVTNAAVTLSLGECFALGAAGLSITDKAGAITATDSSFDVAAMSVDQIEKLAALGVHQIVVQFGSPVLSAAAAAAMEAVGISLSIAAPSVGTVVDGAVGGEFLQLSAAQILGLPSLGVTALRIVEGALLTVAQAEAILTAQLQVTSAPAPNTPSPDYTFAIADSAADIERLSATQLAALARIGVTGLIAIDGSLNLSLAQLEQAAYITVLAGTSVYAVDTTAHINASWNYLMELRGAGTIAGIQDGVAKVSDTAPGFAGTPGGPIVSATASLPLADMTISPGLLGSGGKNAPTLTVTVQILNAVGRATDALGVLSGMGLTHTGVGTYQLSGQSASALTAELQAIQLAETTPSGSNTPITLALTISNGTLTAKQTVTVRTEQPGLVFGTAVYYPSGGPFGGGYYGPRTLYVTNGTTPTPITGPTDPALITQLGAESIYEDGPYSAIDYQATGIFVTNGGSCTQLMFPDTNPATFLPTIGPSLGYEALVQGTNAEGELATWVTDGTEANSFEIGIPAIAGEIFYQVMQADHGIVFSVEDTDGYSEVYYTANNFQTAELLLPSTVGEIGGSAVLGQTVVVLTSLGLYAVDPLTGNSTLLSSTAIGQEPIYSLGGVAVFTSVPYGPGPWTLWATNATVAGTQELDVAGASTTGIGLAASDFTPFGRLALFDGYDSSGLRTFWVTDGTIQGTIELDPVQGTQPTPIQTSFVQYPSQLAEFGTEALFTGFDKTGNTDLWITNGTSAGTRPLLSLPSEINFTAYFNSIQFLSAIGSNFYFTTESTPQNTTDYGPVYLWVTNGTVAGTQQVAQLPASTSVSGATGVSLNDSSIQVGTTTLSLSSKASNTSITVPADTSMTLNKMSFVTAIASGGDTIFAGGQGQTLAATGRAPGAAPDTLTGASAGGDLFLGTTAQMNGEIISDFLGSDVIDITDMPFIGAGAPGATGLAVTASGANSLLTITQGSHSATMTLTGTFGASDFTLNTDQAGGTVVALAPFH